MAKAEYLDKGDNPRFVVTSLAAQQWPAQDLYEKFDRARGEMENRIKEQMCLFADRLSSDEMKANQLRLHLLRPGLHAHGGSAPAGPEGNRVVSAQVDTIRLKTAQNRCPRAAQRAPRALGNEFHLSLERPLRTSLLCPALLKPAGLHVLALSNMLLALLPPRRAQNTTKNSTQPAAQQQTPPRNQNPDHKIPRRSLKPHQPRKTHHS